MQNYWIDLKYQEKLIILIILINDYLLGVLRKKKQHMSW